MTLEDFRAMVGRLQRDIPAQFEGGVVDFEVSPKTLPHPVFADIYTLGECIPLNWSGDGADLQSRIVLYHGSFQALAHLRPGFDWRAEAWETLTHELRHHLEFRAKVAALDAYDWAAEHNFARQEGRPFDPLFYRSGERVADGVYKVDDDVFIESGATVTWHGRRYRVALPTLKRPAFVTLHGLADPPPGDVILVLTKRASLWDLWRRAVVTQVDADVESSDG